MARRISPALADLSQDIAGDIPVDLILRWATGARSKVFHQTLIEPHLIKGTVVSSDSAGLSKLSAQKTLFEVLQLTSQPKEIIYAYGKIIGGRAIGMWIADNTQMFYSEDISPDKILAQMSAAQTEINNLPVKVGIGIHRGEFIDIGGGLFGSDADVIEDVTENHTEGGELVVSHNVKSNFNEYTESFRIRSDLSPQFTMPFYRFEYDSTSLQSLGKSQDSFYPAPFDLDFSQYLRTVDIQDKAKLADIEKKYTANSIVILFKVQHRKRRLLLDQLTDWVIVNSLMNKYKSNSRTITKIKSNGNLGIFLSRDPQDAFEFAYDLSHKLKAANYEVSFGISYGEVFLFPVNDAATEIAGSPVNIASKLAEDKGEAGHIYIESTVQVPHLPGKSEPFAVTVSGVELTGKMVTL